MDEKQNIEETQTVTEEIATQEQHDQESEAVHVEKEETQQEINHRALRQLKEIAEQERDELRRQLQQMEDSRKPQVQQHYEEEAYDFSIAPDDLVEGKHLSAVSKKIRQLEEQVKNYQQQTAVSGIESRLKTQYPDFDSVVTKENIEIFKTAYPDLANAIGSSSDLYSKGMSTYTLIKKFGIHQSQNMPQSVDRVRQNLSKPASSASVGAQSGDTPLSKANMFAGGLTPELKQKLYREMLECSK